MSWNSRTNMRAVESTIRVVVETCRQMEEWRRLLRHLERIERQRDAPGTTAHDTPPRETPAVWDPPHPPQALSG